MSKFKRGLHFVKISGYKPSCLFYAKTGCYSMFNYNSRHYWFMFFGMIGIRYTVEW